MKMHIAPEEYFLALSRMFLSGDGVYPGCESDELWFDVADIGGMDLRYEIDHLNAALEADGLICRVTITGAGEGRLHFTPKGLAKIKQQ